MKTCINKVTFFGSEESMRTLSSILEEDFSMNSLVPINLNLNKDDLLLEKICNWGCEEDMDVLTYIYCNFKPFRIDMSYTTDIPNSTFLRNVSLYNNAEITHCYYDEQEGYVGYSKYVNGEEVESSYNEDPKTSEYRELAIELGFIDKHEKVKRPKQVVISMKDLLELKGGN